MVNGSWSVELFQTGTNAALLTLVLILLNGSKRSPAADFISPNQGSALVLKTDTFEHYIDSFNANDQEIYPGYITNSAASDFLKDNIPSFECPDKDVETI